MSKEFFDAIRAGDENQVRALLASDPRLLASKDDKGLSPFVAAKYSGRNDVAAILLEQGVELDLFAACMAGADQRVMELARGENGSVNSYSQDGWTPLHLAASSASRPRLRLCIARGADVNARSRNAMQNTPLHAAAARPVAGCRSRAARARRRRECAPGGRMDGTACRGAEWRRGDGAAADRIRRRRPGPRRQQCKTRSISR